MGTFCLFLVPIIGLTVMLTLTLDAFFNDKSSEGYPLPKTDLTARAYELPIDTPAFQTGDQALFNFTGDTVLVLSQPDSLSQDEVRVLYKSSQGGFQTVDLPDNWLVKINTDTVGKTKPVTQEDKIQQYKN